MMYTVRAPAKINLHLGVGGPRPDGFHPLHTVYQAVGVCDDVSVARSAGWSLRLDLPDWIDPDSVPLGGDNIVHRAAVLLAAHHGLTEVHAEVSIAKSIPVAGGMAGGSADAAAALVALDRLWGLETTDDDLLSIAGELGSDVPFALIGGTALGTGHGELVEPVADDATWWWVAVCSDEGMSTPAVYRHFDELHPEAGEPPPADDLLAAIASGDVHALAATLHNDLQAAAFDLRPDLADVIALGEAEGALRGLLSGSGPTCVFLNETADDARAVATAFTEQGHEVVLVSHGPVAGAHVVTYA
jgi:4-diphosphocytidyl-2-C-methyl-D-erythritol kinase